MDRDASHNGDEESNKKKLITDRVMINSPSRTLVRDSSQSSQTNFQRQISQGQVARLQRQPSQGQSARDLALNRIVVALPSISSFGSVSAIDLERLLLDKNSLSIWTIFLGYPQLAHYFVDMLGLAPVTTESLKERGLHHDVTRNRLIREFNILRNQVLSSPSTTSLYSSSSTGSNSSSFFGNIPSLASSNQSSTSSLLDNSAVNTPRNYIPLNHSNTSINLITLNASDSRRRLRRQEETESFLWLQKLPSLDSSAPSSVPGTPLDRSSPTSPPPVAREKSSTNITGSGRTLTRAPSDSSFSLITPPAISSPSTSFTNLQAPPNNNSTTPITPTISLGSMSYGSLPVSSRKRKATLALSRSPSEIIAKRVVRPIPAFELSVDLILGMNMDFDKPSPSSMFRIVLLDDSKNPIENVLTGQVIVDAVKFISDPNNRSPSNSVSVIFDDVKISITSVVHYKGQWRYFYFGIYNYENQLVSICREPFYVCTHGEYFKREINASLNNIFPSQISPLTNNSIRLSGFYKSAPIYKWFLKTFEVGQGPGLQSTTSAREVEIDPIKLSTSEINCDLSWNKVGMVSLQIVVRDRANNVVFSSEIREVQVSDTTSDSPMDSPVSPMSVDSSPPSVTSQEYEHLFPADSENLKPDFGFGYNLMTWRVGQGDFEAASKILVENPLLINDRDVDGRTPLIWAMWSGNYALIGLLLERGADPNIRDLLGFSCLHVAAYVGSVEIVELLVRKGAEVNARTIFGDCPIHYAAIKGHTSIIAALMIAGAQVYLENEERETPIHWAQKSNLSSICEWLWASSPMGAQLSPYFSWFKLSASLANLSGDFIAQSDVPLEFQTLMELDALPKFHEVPTEQRFDLFLRKLRQCCATWHHTKVNDHNRSKMIKRQALCELLEFIPLIQNIPEILYAELSRMVSVNIFRALPARRNPPDVPYHPDEDEPILAFDWMHVEVVYTLLNYFMSLQHFDMKIAIRYMNQTFVSNLLDLFNTEDVREREQLKISLHRIYGAFLPHRTFIRNEIKNIFCTYVYETNQYNGIAELLEIVASFAAGLAIPLKPEHKRYFVEAILPLYKGRLYSLYSQQLQICVLTYLEKDLGLSKLIFATLLRFWPLSNSQKTLLFLTETEEVLTYYTNSSLHLLPFCLNVLRKIATCAASSHYQIAERALYIFNNEVITHFIATHIKHCLPCIFGAFYENKLHWHESIRTSSSRILQMFKHFDGQLYAECKERYKQQLIYIQQQRQYAQQEQLQWGAEKSQNSETKKTEK